MTIWVCISHVIFKTRKSCGFGYALVASISKQENHVNLGMCYLRHFQNRKIMQPWLVNSQFFEVLFGSCCCITEFLAIVLHVSDGSV
jgi:hypothetical protein